MKSPYVGDLAPNEAITAIFLVLSKEIRQKKTGEPYLSLHLADKTGEVEAKMWDNVAEVMDTFDRDDFVKVKGLGSGLSEPLAVHDSQGAARGRERSRSGGFLPLLRARFG